MTGDEMVGQPEGMPDLSGLLSQMQQMQQQLMDAQAEAAATRSSRVSAGGGVVKVQVTGGDGVPVGHHRPGGRSTPTTSTCSRTWCWPPSATPSARANELTARRLGGLGLGGLGRLLGGLTSAGRRVYAGPVQDLIDELGPAARHRAQVGPAHRLPPAEAAQGGRPPAGPGHHRGQGAGRRSAPRCFNVAEGDRCAASAPTTAATPTVLCVVEEPRDIVAVEKTREFRGRYHVLQGAISPIEGIGPDQLRVKELLARLEPRGRHRGDPLHQPQHRGRGHRHVPGPAAQARSASRSPASPAACRSAATSSTPTSSPSAGPSRAAARSATEPPRRADWAMRIRPRYGGG